MIKHAVAVAMCGAIVGCTVNVTNPSIGSKNTVTAKADVRADTRVDTTGDLPAGDKSVVGDVEATPKPTPTPTPDPQTHCPDGTWRPTPVPWPTVDPCLAHGAVATAQPSATPHPPNTLEDKEK